VEDRGWPALPLAEWSDTYASLHRYAQIVGKVKLALTPRVNHFWNVGFEVTPRGLSTGEMPSGDALVSVDFDLIDHNLVARTSRGETRALALVPRTVADFYREAMAVFGALGVRARIDERPVEMQSERIRFSEDRLHGAYDPEPVGRCLRVLQRSAAVLDEFRAGFLGKASPVLFWWGTFDVSANRYSGRPAPPRPGADSITREAYSHEVFSCGFWPGDARYPRPGYFAYIAPTPEGFSSARPSPAARWDPSMGEFLLPYDAIREAPDPAATLLSFFENAYDAAANLAGWDRATLDRPHPEIAAQPSPTLH
jgi:hypothetical protein